MQNTNLAVVRELVLMVRIPKHTKHGIECSGESDVRNFLPWRVDQTEQGSTKQAATFQYPQQHVFSATISTMSYFNPL